MKISLNWMREFCEWQGSVDDFIQRLTLSGTEVEAVEGGGLAEEKVVVARIESFVPHPNADRLRLCQVTDGTRTYQIVCGATNFKQGDLVPLALPGSELPNGLKIKKSKLRGETSEGMLCSAPELGLPGEAAGLMILPPDTALGRPVKELFPGDVVLDLEITPNRADLLSYEGLARELVALGATPVPRPQFREAPGEGDCGVQLTLESDSACTRYTARVIEGVKVGPSPAWLKAKLEAVGLRSINNVVDITNLVLLETGQPLHAFDGEKVRGDHLRVRRAAKGERLLALDGRTYELDAEDTVIADAEGPMAIGGVMGGEWSGVNESTTWIVLESASFEPGAIRRTSRRLGLITDSSYRFERGVDPSAVDRARVQAESLILDLTGGRVRGPRLEAGCLPTSPPPVPLRHQRLEAIYGAPIEPKRVEDILTALGCELDEAGWKIPLCRPDLRREIDLIEEVVRFEGLDRVPSAIPQLLPGTSRADRVHEVCQGLRQRLAALGFHEMINLHLLPRGTVPGEVVRVLLPLNEDYVELRSSLVPGALPVARRNLGAGAKALRLFELGEVMVRQGDEVHEELHLLLLMGGEERPKHWTEPARAVDGASLRGVVEALEVAFSGQFGRWQIGPIAPEQLKREGIKVPLWAAEGVLNPQARARVTFQPWSSYPAVTRDLAWVMDEAVSYHRLVEVIQSCRIRELEEITCFDVFRDTSGIKLPKGRKSYAISLTFRSPDRTLTDVEVARWVEEIVAKVGEKLGALLRQS